MSKFAYASFVLYFWELKGLPPFKILPKGSAFGNRHFLKKVDKNFCLSQLYVRNGNYSNKYFSFVGKDDIISV